MQFKASFHRIERDLLLYNDFHRMTLISPPTKEVTYKKSINFVIEVKYYGYRTINLGLIEGVRQLTKNSKVLAGGIPVLVADLQNFVRWAKEEATDKSLDLLASEIKKNEDLGGGLMLESNMNTMANSRLTKVIDEIRLKTKKTPVGYYGK